jgi:hypothetical protein
LKVPDNNYGVVPKSGFLFGIQNFADEFLEMLKLKGKEPPA